MQDTNEAVSGHRVFVTGATGFIGRNTCRALLKAGHAVVGLARREPDADDEARVDGVSYVVGDVTDAKRLTPELLDGCDCVAHLVGIIAEVPSKGQTFEAVHVQGTRNLVTAAKAAGISHRFVYVSAIGAAPDGPSEYSRTKAQAESAVRESGLPYTILRPSLVIGQGGEFLAQMEQLIRRPPLSPFPVPFVPVPGSGENRFQPVAVSDLADVLVRCLTGTATENQTYDVGGGTIVTFDELLNAIQGRIHSGNEKHAKRLVHVPLPLMVPAAAVLETLLPHPPVTTDQLAMLGRDNIADNAPLRAATGFDPLPFDAVLDRAYAPDGGDS